MNPRVLSRKDGDEQVGEEDADEEDEAITPSTPDVDVLSFYLATTAQ